jgi:hypothetical protein
MKIPRMKWLLLALVVASSSAQQANAEFRIPTISTNRSIEIGNQRFGFTDWSERREGVVWSGWPMRRDPPTYLPVGSKLHMGPLGEFNVPFSATQGLIGCCVVVGMLAVLPALVVSRSARKRAVEGRSVQ